MNIDAALRRRGVLEEMTGDETLKLAYELLDEVARLRESANKWAHKSTLLALWISTNCTPEQVADARTASQV